VGSLAASTSRHHRALLESAAIAAAVVSVAFALQARLDLSLGDEGFLWYGALRTRAGDVPLRDFRSYDPGRYYWAAAWLWALASDSVVSVRFASAVFQWIGVTAALLAVRRVVERRMLLVMAALVVWLWMFPLFRAYDTTLAVTGVWVALLLLEQPSTRRHFMAGVYTGLAAWFGRNHGVYLLLGFVAVTFCLAYRVKGPVRGRRFLALGTGVVVGYLPMLLMLSLAPGLLPTLLELVRASPDSFNPRAVPWPWRRAYDTLPVWRAARALTLGLFFVALPSFYLVAVAALRRAQEGAGRNLLMAATFIGIPYVHAGFSRADVLHLATAVQPMLIGIVAMAFNGHRRRRGTIVLAACLLASLLAMGLRQPFADWALGDRANWVRLDVRGSSLLVEPTKSRFVQALMQWREETAGADETLLLTPRWTTLYAVLGVKAPVWDVLPILRASEEEQVRMLQDLDRNRVRWAVTCEGAAEVREERTFRSTHPLVWARLRAWEIVPTDGLPDGCVLRHRSS
jgi:hypothetical protein